MRTSSIIYLVGNSLTATRIVLLKVKQYSVICVTAGYTMSAKESQVSYMKTNAVFSQVTDVLYYCEFNYCNSSIKQLVSDLKLSQSEFPPVEEINKSVQSLSSTYDSLIQSVSQ